MLASPRAFDEMTIAAAGTPAGGPSGPGLEPVEVARLLRQNPVFERATVDQLRDLVAVTQEVRLTSGDVLLVPGHREIDRLADQSSCGNSE